MTRFHFPTIQRRNATRIVALGLALGTPLSSVVASVSSAESTTTASVQGLGVGARGDAVLALQNALISRGITVVGGADGVFGSKTLEALNAFRAGVGLPSSDTVDTATAVALGLQTAATTGLTRGSRGAAVVELQNALIAAGHTPNGGADGMNGDLRIFPALGVVVVALSNFDPPAATRLVDSYMQRMPLTP